MGTVTMDLQELKALENKVKETQEKSEQEKALLNQEIETLQKQKGELLANQKRVIFSKKDYQIIKYLPISYEEIEKSARLAIQNLQDHYYFQYRREDYFSYFSNVLNSLPQYFVSEVFSKDIDRTQKGIDTIKEINPEQKESFEFINLDEAVNIALEQKGSIYGEKLKSLEKENIHLTTKLTKIEAKAEENIAEIKEGYEKELKETIKKKDSEYEALKISYEQKYTELEKNSNEKYKKLEEEFAKYKDDETKMNLNDKLEKYKNENSDLRKEIEELKKQLKSKSLFGRIFG